MMPNSNPIDAFVGARLRKRRMQRGWSLHVLSSLTSVSSARLLRFEEGLERIPAEIMITLCGVLEIQSAYFFERISHDDEITARGRCDVVRVRSSGARRRL